MSREHVTVFEHSSLYFNQTRISPRYFRALVSFNGLHGNKYFTVGNQKLIFKSYVGVIQVGNLVLEILPKLDKGLADVEALSNKWQRALPDILRNAGYIKLNSIGNASQGKKASQILEIYLQQFLQLVDELIHGGLTKKYCTIESNASTLKGRLNFPKHLKHNLTQKQKFYVFHNVYQANNVFNIILKRALTLISERSRNASIVSEARKLNLSFSNIDSVKVTAETFSKLKFDKKTQRYKDAIELARLIILQLCPDMQKGNHQVLAVLFDMNKLFERYIFKLLKKEEKNNTEKALRVSGQASVKFWKNKTIRPDIVITFKRENEDITVVLDTKWKKMVNNSPDNNDLKQMFTYNIQFGANHSVLFYPAAGLTNLGKEPFVQGKRLSYDHCCEVYFGRIFNDNDSINNRVAADFIDYITK